MLLQAVASAATPFADEMMTLPLLRPALRDARIVLVDDSGVVRKAIRRLLAQVGLESVFEAEDGLEALDLVEKIEPDMVITDLVMPRLDGLGFCRQLRANERWKDVPVLVLTGASSSAERVEVFFNGATDLIGKPLNLRELVGRVQVHLEQRMLVRELIAHRQALDRDLDLAREMQEALLPDDRAIHAIEERFPLRIASRYRASQHLGGDLWRIRASPQGTANVVMTDFAGHGISAALNTFRLDSFQRGMHLASMPLGDAFQAVNTFLCDTLPRGQFATHLVIRIDLDRDEIEVCSAGAPAPLLDEGGKGRFAPLPSAGIPLGLMREAEHAPRRFPFPPGSRLFLYSDGLVETPSPPSSRFDTQSLADFLSAIPSRMHPAVTIAEVERALHQFVPEDDLTMVAIKRRTEP